MQLPSLNKNLNTLRIDLSCCDIVPTTKYIHCVTELFHEASNEWIAAAVTDPTPNSESITFETPLNLFYSFGECVRLRFSIYQTDGNFGSQTVLSIPAELYEKQGILFQPHPLHIPTLEFLHSRAICDIEDILTEPSATLRLSLTKLDKSCGTLIVSATDTSKSRYFLTLQFGTKNLGSSAFTREQKRVIITTACGQRRHESIKSTGVSEALNPIWRPVTCSIAELCNGDLGSKCIKLDIEIGGKVIGSVTTSVNELLSNAEFPIKKVFSEVNQGILKIVYYEISMKNSFLDYISDDQELKLMVAIDFTASNGTPSDADSLHFYCGEGLNLYERIIQRFGEKILKYSEKQKVATFGYGGTPLFIDGCKHVSHCFPLNGNIKSPEISGGIPSVLQTYKERVTMISFDGPTVFSEVIGKAIEMMKSMNSEQISLYSSQSISDVRKEKYLVLLILTDGSMSDFRDSVDAIYFSSFLPISIVIVGIGKSHTKQLKLLNSPFKSSLEDLPFRHNVSYLQFSDYLDDNEFLNAALSPIPTQFLEYFHKNSILPTALNFKDSMMLKKSSVSMPVPDVVPAWRADSSAKTCHLCNTPFSMMNRKHHCRACGMIVCQYCSMHGSPIPQFNLLTPQRCCDVCFAYLLRVLPRAAIGDKK